MKEIRYIFLGQWPHHRYYAGDNATLKIAKSPNKELVITATDMPHVGASDVMICYQISRADYEHLLAMSRPHAIPNPPVPATITNQYYNHFLCSESAYAIRNEFTLRDVDLSLCDEYLS